FLLPVEVRAPSSPYEMWDFYRKNRTEYDVMLVPVSAATLRDRVAKADKKQLEALLKDPKYASAYKALIEPPTEAELNFFYKERRANPYDPSSDKCGVQTPHQVKAEYIFADPQSESYQKYYRGPAQALAALKLYPPAWIPTSPLATAVR